MWGYIVRRLLWAGLVLLAITALTYTIFFVMPPVDPVALFAGKSPTPEVIAQVKHHFGLDEPIWVQFGTFLKNLVTGDEYGWPGLGFSYTTRSSIKALLMSRLIVTATLAIGAALIWITIGFALGVLSAMKYRRLADRMGMGFAVFFVSAPAFWLGLMMLWLLWFKLGVAPGTGYYGPSTYGPVTWLSHMIMPWLALALPYAAWYARMMRSTLLETLNQDYIRTARAKGLSEAKVVLKHGVRASLTPLVTMLGVDLGTLFGGAIIVEVVFNLQGLGQWVVTAVPAGDLPVILAVTLVAAIMITLANLVVDVLYAFLDPRVRLS